MSYEGLSSLDSGVRYFANFLRIEFGPSLSVKSFEEGFDERRMDHVDECIAYIASVLEVNRKIEEIVLVEMSFVQQVHDHFLCVLVWNIFDHKSRSLVSVVLQVLQINCKTVLLVRNKISLLLSASQSTLHVSFRVELLVILPTLSWLLLSR